MKKIKKITLLKLDSSDRLDSSQMKELIGGGDSVCYIDTLGPADPACDYFKYFNLNGRPAYHGSDTGDYGGNGGSNSYSGCGCSYCSAEEGGFGFSVGMMIRGRNDMG